MEKRNTLLLTVIAVATLLVAVVGATFAYFAGTQDVGAGLNLTATTEPASSSFIASSDDPIELDITADLMLAAQAKNDGSPVDTDTGKLTVSFASAAEGTAMSCTYDIVYKWTGDAYTAHSNGAAGLNEFTISYAVENSETTNTTNGTVAIENTAEGETDFADIADIATEATIVNDAVIWSNSKTATTSVYTFTAKFYNLAVDQSGLADKTFAGNFSVKNVVC
ncbi:MAG: hypothetical protein IJO63_05360 [Bacilli bacterium]|nr:hypothetical protein [Bacilli bacterium]